MTAIDDPATGTKAPTGDGRRSKTPPTDPEPTKSPELLSLTINPETAAIVRLEGVDGSGARHELSKEQTAKLAQLYGEGTLQALIEDAFEAGIASVLGDGAGEFGTSESKDEAELRHLLLKPLIERSAARHLMKRATLARATLASLLRHSVEPAPRPGATRPSQASPGVTATKP